MCKRGRGLPLPDAANPFCLMIKNLYGLALCQTAGMVRNLQELTGLDRDVPATP